MEVEYLHNNDVICGMVNEDYCRVIVKCEGTSQLAFASMEDVDMTVWLAWHVASPTCATPRYHVVMTVILVVHHEQ